VIADSRFHRRSNAQGLMNPAKVVIHVMKSDGCNVKFNLLRERIGQAGEAPHLHSHRQVLPFDIACADMLLIGPSNGFFLFASDTRCRGVSGRAFGNVAPINQLSTYPAVRGEEGASLLDHVGARGPRGFHQRVIGCRDRQLVTDSQLEVGGVVGGEFILTG
jgi:hypothetical protein